MFRIHSEDGTLEKTCTVRSREIAEPRHFVFHPSGVWCYGVNEKDYSVTAYQFDTASGTLTPRQILPTPPDTYTGDGWASGIVMMPDGRHVVVSNRKHDSITSFAIREDGLLSYCDCIKSAAVHHSQPVGHHPCRQRNDRPCHRVHAGRGNRCLQEYRLEPCNGKPGLPDLPHLMLLGAIPF